MRKGCLFLLICVLVATICLLVGFKVGGTDVAYAIDEHTVTFYLSNDEVYQGATQLVEDGSCAMVPVTPIKDGYAFLYWKNGDDKFSFKTPVTGDLNLHAVWFELEAGVVVTEMFTVEFRVNDILVNAQNIKDGGSAIAPTDFNLPEGKCFVQWDKGFTNVHSNLVVNAVLADKYYDVYIYGLGGLYLTNLSVKHGSSVDLATLDVEIDHYILDEEAAQSELTNITTDRDVYLMYTLEKHQVSFWVGDDAYGAVQNIDYGSYARFPEIPERTGYIFIGWYTDLNSNTMFSFNTAIEANTTLYAKYIMIENKKYSVKFFNYDQTQFGGTQMIEEGRVPILPGTPYREGYTFTGWAIDGDVDAIYDFETPITEDTVLYAVFSIRTYTVKVYDGRTLISEQQVRYGENAEAPEVQDTAGYIFIGFSDSFKNITKDMRISVLWKARTFAVMFFDYNYKKIGATQYVEYYQSATAPNAPAREGYTFVGWDQSFEYVVDDMAIFPIYDRIHFTYSYVDGDQIRTMPVYYGETATMIPMEKDGYIFLGWFEGDDLYDFNTLAYKDYTLVAHWEETVAVTYTVVFKVDGEEYNRQVVEENTSAITPSNPTKVGYTFTGWDKAYNNVQSDLIVNAQFEINTYTVTFVANGVSNPVQYEYNSLVEVPETPQKTGHIFNYWETVKGVEYDFKTPITENFTLTAKFTPEVYTVVFMVEDETYSTQRVSYGGYATIPTNPQATGKNFVGWYINDEQFSFSTAIVGTTTLVARFESVTYNVYFYVNNELYTTLSYEFGETIVAPAEPTHNQWTTFSGWTNLPETMPANNVTIYATLIELPTYTLYYFVEDDLYDSVEYHEGETIISADFPEYDDYVVVAWLNLPTTMPDYDLSVSAQLKYYRTITYYVIEDIYTEQKVLVGDAIPDVEEPEVEGMIFVEWIGLPQIMPDKDVSVYADLTLIEEEDEPNTFVLTYDTVNGKYVLSITGEVLVGGFIGYIEVNGDVTSVTLADTEHATYNVVDGVIRFVWANGDNVDEDMLVLEFVSANANNPTLVIEEIYAFADEDIVDVEYNIK